MLRVGFRVLGKLIAANPAGFAFFGKGKEIHESFADADAGRNQKELEVVLMRIKWTSLHSVLLGNTVAPWVGPGLAERLKRESVNAHQADKKDKKLTERAMAWFRRSRYRQD